MRAKYALVADILSYTQTNLGELIIGMKTWLEKAVRNVNEISAVIPFNG